MKKTVVTITGIRPDFIRMSFVFKELDNYFNHILIHTGQHYDKNLSNVFFNELNIRSPDYILETGKTSSNHFEQLSYLSNAIPKLFKEKNIQPDMILFLGDSNSAGVSFPLKKEGYKIGHIEAGMRSYDKRMLEEINRTVCDHCSDILFVYHEDYKKQLEFENIKNNVFVVGNTIVEPFTLFKEEIFMNQKKKDMILMDIHRPENFNYPERLKNVLHFGNICIQNFNIPVKLLYFKRLQDAIEKYNLDLGNIEIIPLLPYKEYLETVYNCKFIISDSGTGQEEPALLNTPVVVPRDFTERPQSYENNCSIQLKIGEDYKLEHTNKVLDWIKKISEGELLINSTWLGQGNTSKLIIKELYNFLHSKNTNLPIINTNNTDYSLIKPFPYLFQDDFLNDSFGHHIQQEILSLPNESWDRYDNPFEQKYTLRDKFNFPPLLQLLFDKFQEPTFVTKLSEIVGYPLLLDTARNFWGVHKYKKDDKLDIHVDAGLHPTLELKKQVTLGLYLSYNWKEEYGCELEIWKGENSSCNYAQIYEKVQSLSPIFNRLVMFTCNDYAWHGNPTPAICKDDSSRIFITISYLSENFEDKNTRKKAFFVKRPEDPYDEEKDKLRYIRADNEKYKQVYRV
jgi:UDP-N-acetylglucosamine 2-epimerase (non-hydrolysing)